MIHVTEIRISNVNCIYIRAKIRQLTYNHPENLCFLTLVRQCNDLRHSPSAPLLPDPEPLLSPSPEPQTQPADVTVSEPEPGCVRAEHNSAFCWDQFRELWPGSGGGPRPAQTRRVVSRSQPPHGSGSAVGPCKGTTINYVSTDLEWGQKYVYIILK